MTDTPQRSIREDWKGGAPAPGWRELLRAEFQRSSMQNLIEFLDMERARHTIYPEPRNIFRAFTTTDFPAVKVVILGQDPYHGPGQANGLCFSVQEGVPLPPSLQNIFREIESDLGTPPPPHGSLDRWARQGVFLLNTVLTVRAGVANSHAGKGWEEFTGSAIQALAQRPEPIVFMLWGRYAGQFAKSIDASRHLVLKCAHPSPLSAHSGFFGCRHFSKANQFLQEHGLEPIVW